MAWTLILGALVALLVGGCLASKSFKFFAKHTLYGICLVISCAIASLVCLARGRTTNNHYVIFKLFQWSVAWMNISVRLDKQNLELLESDEPFIMVANHQAALDVYTMTFVWPKNCVVILKNTLKYVPGFNLCAYLACAIYINRFDRTRAHASIGDAEKAIRDHKRKVFIYPEGTRNTGVELLPFKKGAFVISKSANVPIVPVVFSSYKRFYDYDAKRFGSGDVRIRVLPKIYPDGKTHDEIVTECRSVMEKALKQISDESNIED